MTATYSLQSLGNHFWKPVVDIVRAFDRGESIMTNDLSRSIEIFNFTLFLYSIRHGIGAGSYSSFSITSIN